MLTDKNRIQDRNHLQKCKGLVKLSIKTAVTGLSNNFGLLISPKQISVYQQEDPVCRFRFWCPYYSWFVVIYHFKHV
jgi:hypothetical protein